MSTTSKETKTTTAKAAEAKAEVKADTKTTAKKAETKTTAKKATTTKKAATKSTTKKATTAKSNIDIKTSVAVQFFGKEVFADSILEEVKKAWVEQFEGKLEDIKTIDLYIKPEEHKAYFVVNGLSNGNYFINL